jgi:signal transduction histidine kinase
LSHTMPQRTPTLTQLIGLAVTLGAVGLFAAFTLRQLDGLRRLETEIIDRNRRDSLQLIRIENNLNQIGLALRDMAEGVEPYPVSAYRQEFDRLKQDLEDALRVEATLTVGTSVPAQRALLQSAFERFWTEASQLWALAASGREAEAKSIVRTRLEAERATMSSTISRLLILNNEAEAAAAREIETIYSKVELNLYMLVVATVAAILLTGFFVIRHDRRVFDKVGRLSEQRRQLAMQVISVQEDLFRSLARELHDEFGQVLTAIGVMLQRTEKRLPAESSERGDIREVREIANQTLERVRSMSQMLHPPVLDDYGLEKSIEWYIGQFGRQAGLQIHYEKIGVAPWIGDQVAIHVYRVLQESLNNVVRHSGVHEAWVRVSYTSSSVSLEVEDHGAGLPEKAPEGRGIGMISMRERAELLGGSISMGRRAGGGTRIALQVPLATAPTGA